MKRGQGDDHVEASTLSLFTKRQRNDAKATLRSLSDEITKKFDGLRAECVNTLESKRRWVNELDACTKKAYPGSRLVLVGSSMNMFGLKNSDCDLTLMISGNYGFSATAALSKIEKILPKPRFHATLISGAKVPVLKIKDRDTSLEGDINVNCHRNIRHSYLFRCYALLDDRIQPLGLIIKLWAKKAGIINQRDHKLSGFSLLVLYFYYLQVGCTPPVVPLLQSKYPEHFSESIPVSTIADNLNTEHQPEVIKNFVSQNKQKLGELFLGFFRFYSSFDWSKVISIRRSSAYVSNRRPHMLIEDPYEPGGNSARGIYESYGFLEIKRAFSSALKKLQDDLSLDNLV